jgi:hypothetical protein
MPLMVSPESMACWQSRHGPTGMNTKGGWTSIEECQDPHICGFQLTNAKHVLWKAVLIGANFPSKGIRQGSKHVLDGKLMDAATGKGTVSAIYNQS